MNSTKKNNLVFAFYSVGVVFFIVVIAIISGLFYYQERGADEEVYLRTQDSYVANLNESITKIFSNVVADIRILSKYKELDRFLADGNDRSLKDFSQELLDFVSFKGIYDQARFLDTTGQEIVRINYNNGRPGIVATEDLQNKGERYYFTDSFVLDENEVFISPFDLNIESGEIELPLKPMIRVAIPVFFDGEKKGVLILNYLGEQIFDSMRLGEASGIEVNLLNQNGYWLFNPYHDNDWGFMYDEKTGVNLPEMDSELWRMIDLHEEKQFFHNGALYTTRTIHPYVLAQASSLGSNKPFSPSLAKLNPLKHRWELYSVVPEKVLYKNSSELLVSLIIIDTVFILMMIVILLILYKSSKDRRASELRIHNLNDILQIINKILRHDLANSFTAVKASLEVFQDSKSDEALVNANGAVASGIRLINKMRQLESALSNEKGKELFAVEAVIQKATAGMPLEVNIEGSGSVMADQALEVVFSNLASNAVRHGGAKKINVLISKVGRFMQVEFADDGAGIPVEIRDKVFDEGFKSGEKGGSGLGLYIAEKTMERYGGSISVEENKPQGAKFVIKIPIA